MNLSPHHSGSIFGPMNDSLEKDPQPPQGPTRLTPSDVADTPHVYTNGFLKVDNQPVIVLHMSYTLAKTLAKMTGEMVKKFETAVGRDMLVTADVDAAFAAAKTAKKPGKKNGGSRAR